MRSARCMPLLLSSKTRATDPSDNGHEVPAIWLRRVASVDEAGAKAQHGPRGQLADARLRDAEDLADLSERQVLVVVEGDDELLALGQPRDRLGDAVLEVGLVHDRRGVRRV